MVDRKWYSMRNNLISVVAMVATFDVCFSSVCQLEPLHIKDNSTTSQSSTYSEYPAQNAVDGNVKTFSQTADDETDSNPWWQLDLEGEYWLGRVTVIICEDSCGGYFNGVVVRAGLNEDYSENEQCNSSVTQPSNGALVELMCDPPALAKHIRLYKDQPNPTDGRTSLKIVEVLIYEYASEECAKQSEAISLNGILTSQSSNYTKYPAIRANDGNVNTFSKTDDCCDPHPWWMVDLGSTSWVGTIIVTLRQSCCGSRFIGAIARAGVNDTVSANAQCGSAVTNEQASTGAVVQFKCFPPLNAQYISLEINQSKPEDPPDLEIAEVAVKHYKSEECVPNNTLALNDNSTSASSYKNPAQDACDGNINTFSTTTANESETKHWWMVDLGATRWVGKVTVIFKSGHNGAQIIVRTGNSSDYTENTPCGQLMVQTEASVEFLCTTLILARYVSVDVQLPPREVLQIAEVFVKEFASGDCRARPKAEVRATSQSSDHVTDGYTVTDGNLNASPIGITDGRPWWMIEFMDESWLTRVTVTLHSVDGFIGAVARVGLNPESLNVTCGSPATERQCEAGAVIQFLCDTPTLARFVYLSIDSDVNGSRQAVFEIANVMVDDYETQECAPANGATSNGWTAQQTNNNVLSSANAIDGNINTFFETGHGDEHPWWQLDLGNDYWLGAIAVTLRTDCCERRFLEVVARAGPNLDYTMNGPCALAGEPTNKTGYVVEFLCDPPVFARYISLDIDQSGPGVIHAMLQIAEVIVKEYNSQECVSNDTLGVSNWTATQSSDVIRNPARDATDGSIATYSSTLREPHPWWRFNLGSEHWLGKITLILATTGASQSDITLTVRAGTSTNYTENSPCGSSVTETGYQQGAVIERVCDPPVKASYVTVDLDSGSSTDTVLRIAEIAVKTYASEDCARNSTSTAIKAKASQSSQVELHPGINANDGSTGTYFKSANFVDDPHPWWKVDLVDEHCIGRITVKFKDNTMVDSVTAKVCSANDQCSSQCTPTRVTDPETTQSFRCDPPFLAKSITLAVRPSVVPAAETTYLQIAEVIVEQYLSEVGPCLKWDDPNRKTKSAYISKKIKGSLRVGEGARHSLSTEVTGSLKQCTHHCLNHNSCISLVFSKRRGECSLYSEYQGDLFSPSDVEDSNWVIDLSE